MDELRDVIWYETYRQKSLDDLVLSRYHKKSLESFINEEKIPHLLFHGPPGSGKTTIAKILIDHCSSASRTFNASSGDRGIATIKTTVKQFAGSQIQKKAKMNIIFFDEADGLTNDAQMALKNTIERYHKNCRFIFTANHLEMIIDEIQSRCIMYKFEQVSSKQLVEHLSDILISEEIEYKKRDLKKLISHFSYDVRTIINNLQAASITGTFRPGDIISIFPTKKIFSSIQKGNIDSIRSITKEHTNFLWLYKELFNNFIPLMPEDIRPEAAIAVAEYLYRDRVIADKEINVSACILDLMNLLEVDIKF